ncbi:hypothetical protein HII36_27920 [Nonomuraea sp. NN258]|uniref:hypothetical protein n=1 Tax=Nonomuraea antri TaxID=2730852 RepID=UPI0015684DD3|nr:hypothetical protein [Nonomuraea antri]NRQ35633.1 hypothetical protein [Nonomuraea antri]
MADYTQPAPVQAGPRRGYALAVVIAGALLVFCAVLPWAGVEARSDLIGGGVSSDVRGVDDRLGVYTLIAGIAVLAFGVVGLLTRPRLAALAVVPGALAVLVLVMFIGTPRGLGDRVTIEVGTLLTVEPVLRFGWFAALASAVAVIVVSVLAVVKR